MIIKIAVATVVVIALYIFIMIKVPVAAFIGSIAAGAFVKSMRTYDLYSFFPNSSAIVDFPTRLAPSISSAVCPSDSFFHTHSF